MTTDTLALPSSHELQARRAEIVAAQTQATRELQEASVELGRAIAGGTPDDALAPLQTRVRHLETKRVAGYAVALQVLDRDIADAEAREAAAELEAAKRDWEETSAAASRATLALVEELRTFATGAVLEQIERVKATDAAAHQAHVHLLGLRGDRFYGLAPIEFAGSPGLADAVEAVELLHRFANEQLPPQQSALLVGRRREYVARVPLHLTGTRIGEIVQPGERFTLEEGHGRPLVEDGQAELIPDGSESPVEEFVRFETDDELVTAAVDTGETADVRPGSVEELQMLAAPLLNDPERPLGAPSGR